MRLYLNQLAGHLQRELKPLYWVTGDEPLLVDEACQQIRQQAKQAGFTERERATVESGFDWTGWLEGSQTMSLFSEKRLLELRVPRGKVEDTGKKSLMAFCEKPSEDMVLLIISPKLDGSTIKTKWVKTLETAGALVTIYPLEQKALPAWISRRMLDRGLKPGPGVADLMAWHFEGNLLAAAQEIDKLALVESGSVSVDRVREALNDQARFDVFKLVDACLAGEAREATRILASLKAEGVAQSLILWALTRELRSLTQIAYAVDGGKNSGMTPVQAMNQARVWEKRQPLMGQALKRQNMASLQNMLQMAALNDRMIKGRAPGSDWEALQDLVLTFAGRQIQAGLVAQMNM